MRIRHQGTGRRHAKLLGVALAAALWQASAAHGSELFTQAYLNPTGESDTNTVFQSGTTTADATLLYEFDTPNPEGGDPIHSVFDGSAAARASYGNIGARVTVSLTDYRAGTYDPDGGPPTPFAGYGSAGFLDTLTVNGGQGTGTLRFLFSATGTTSSSGFAGPGAIFSLSVGGGSVSLNPSFSTGGTVTSTSDAVPFTFGVPFDVRVDLLANAFFADFSFPDPYSGSGTADFFSSLVLTNIVATSSTGSPIPGAALSAASGTGYAFSVTGAAAIPEPGTLPLLISGLGGLFFCGRRLKNRRPA